MNRIKTITLLVLLSLGICTGCIGKMQEVKEQEVEQQKENLLKESILYQKYRDTLQEIDKNRKECTILGEEGWEKAKDCYREFVSETIFGMCEHNNYYWEKDPMNEMKGILTAEEMMDYWGTKTGFGLRIAVSEVDEIWEYSYFESDYSDMKYIACRKEGAKEGDVPEYQLCEEILYHGKVSGSDYDEAEWVEWLDEYGQEIEGEVTEYCVIDNHVYRIDREKEQFHDVTGQTESCMAQWLQREKEKAYYGMQITSETVEKVNELIPDGYRLKSETNVAVCDLNHDGKNDYVVSIYDPVTMSEDEYYDAAEDMWMFLSGENGEYIKKRLVKDRLYCYDLRFVADGVLVCENLLEVDNYGYPMQKDYFFYDDAMEEFYIDRVCQCERNSSVLIEDRTTLENLTIDTYYSSGTRENISNGWAAISSYNVYTEEGRKVEFNSDVIYRNADKEMEKTVNDTIFELELAVAESLLREGDEDIRITASLNYLNPHIYAGCIEGTVWKKDGYAEYNIPIMIDLESGELLDITDLISKEDFIMICKKGMKDRYRNELSEEDRERGISLLEKEYESALRVTSAGELILTTEDTWIYFGITSWGVWIVGKDDAGELEFMLDKEYFTDTPLWHYMEPLY